MAWGIVKTDDFMSGEGLNSVTGPQPGAEISVSGETMSSSLCNDFGIIRLRARMACNP
jgi:hypothetical protein